MTRAIVAEADWKWRSAQPDDIWVPKRGRVGKVVYVTTPMGGQIEMHCNQLVIDQHHVADKSVVVRLEDFSGPRRVMKWASLKKNWKPLIVRELPAVVSRSEALRYSDSL